MARCDCRRDPQAMAVAREFNFSTADLPIEECRHCAADRVAEEQRTKELLDRHSMWEFFDALSDRRKMEMIFYFMYDQGWRPY